MVDTSLRQPLIISHNKPQKIKDKLTALPALAYLRICQEVESESHSRAATCRKVEKHKLSRLFSNLQASTVFCACQLNYLYDYSSFVRF